MLAEETKGGKSTSPVARANSARNEAVRQLISENEDRYKVLLAEKRGAAGLPANAEVAKKQKQAAQAVARLNALGVTVNLDEILAAISA